MDPFDHNQIVYDSPMDLSMNLDIIPYHSPLIATFNPGRLRIIPRNPRLPIQIINTSTSTSTSTRSPNQYIPWEQRQRIHPKSGHIRLLAPPPGELDIYSLWLKDMTLTDWITVTESNERAKTVFHTNQRKRWLARIVLQRWTQRVWRKRTQCNVDMIDMEAFPDSEAIFLTDTKHHQIFRFHRRDIFKNLLANICMSDEMLPSPRPPTNPWTNSKLTLAQTIGICQQLMADYSRRAICPPVLFAAFWAARFSLKRFQGENSPLLSQHAIMSYFKDLTNENSDTVYDTITTLLTNANLHYSSLSIRKWLKQTAQTPLHKEWLLMARDYTLYINLHVQIRPSWYSQDRIYSDVRRLYDRTILPAPISSYTPTLNPIIYGGPTMLSLLGLTYTPDLSGSLIQHDAALQLIQDALFRL